MTTTIYEDITLSLKMDDTMCVCVCEFHIEMWGLTREIRTRHQNSGSILPHERWRMDTGFLSKPCVCVWCVRVCRGVGGGVGK